jgi:hypothetical protein
LRWKASESRSSRRFRSVCRAGVLARGDLHGSGFRYRKRPTASPSASGTAPVPPVCRSGCPRHIKLPFAAQFFDAFNHPQFSNPGTTIGSKTYGQITGTVGSARIVEFLMRVYF